MLMVKDDGVYEIIEYCNAHREVTDVMEKMIINKEAFIMAYNAWIRYNNDWERKLP